VSARLPFTIVAGDDAASKGILLYNGRTLTRSQDVVPSHHLVLASQVFYSGTTSWEVHIDRLGAGTGRVLAGITVNGSDGEGVVWDGLRIVGPNDGESRTLDERFQWRPGTVLRFHLELDGPGCYLNCFYDRDGVARIPLPANGHGWVPAFSVFGPQDQVTVVPSATTQPVGSNAASNFRRHPAHAAVDTTTALERQENLISSLQQQLNTVANRVDHDAYRQYDPQAEAFSSPGNRHASPSAQPNSAAKASPAPASRYGGGGTAAAAPSSPPPAGAGSFGAAGGGQRSPSGYQQGGTTGGGAYGSAPGSAGGGYQLPGAAGAATGPYAGGAASSYQAPPAAAGGFASQPPPSGGGGGARRSGYARDPMETYSPELRRIIRYVEDGDGPNQR
jgi:hypothetical protein